MNDPLILALFALCLALYQSVQERRWAMKMIKEEQEKNPDSCIVCDYHRWGVLRGMSVPTDLLPPHKHDKHSDVPPVLRLLK